MDKIPISEIFGPTIQGEGELVGTLTIFVRVGGCDYKCVWCDSLYAVDPKYKDMWESLTDKEIFDKVRELSNDTPIPRPDTPLMITLTGGNPALYEFSDFIAEVHKWGYKVSAETQGSILKDWFCELDHLILSPKPPSSKMIFDSEKFMNCVLDYKVPKSIKVPVIDERDYEFARELYNKYRKYNIPFCLQTVNSLTGSYMSVWDVDDIREGISERTDQILEWVKRDCWFDVKIQPQLHVLLWGNKRVV